jgi:hypothetical protein
MANQIHQWRDSDVRRAIKLAREVGLAPTVLEINTQSGVIRVADANNTSVEVPRSPPVKRREG